MNFAHTLFLLLAAHSLADYAAQGDFMAKAKDPNGDPAVWPWVLWSHGMIHGGAVLLITGSLGLAVAELIAHCYIDYGKCRKFLGYSTDQMLHVGCKILWAGMLTA